MKRTLLILLFLTSLFTFCNAQAYRHIGIEKGLSSRKVYSIQKDKTGYMWFLTHEGIDRYNGKDIKHYTLEVDSIEISSLQDLNWLYTDSKGVLWEIGKRGRVFRYDNTHDRFKLVYNFPEAYRIKNPTPISYSFIDNKDLIWLCSEGTVYLFNPTTFTATSFDINVPGNISYVTQYDENRYFIGTDQGIYLAGFENETLKLIPSSNLEQSRLQVNNLYYDPASDKLFIGTFQNGLYIFDVTEGNYFANPEGVFSDITITRIKPLNEHEILIATDGAGIYKFDTHDYHTYPYIVADYQNNSLSGNNIVDIFVDSENRIWMSNYPMGVTVRDDRYSNYVWYNHSVGNSQSLINDKVNYIIEDSDGDLWFATNNGVSLYQTKSGKWDSFLSSFDPDYKEKNHVFLSLCETEPGIVSAGGYSSNIYQIDKKSKKSQRLPYEQDVIQSVKPDKYIRSIIKDSSGNIWIGGFYNLKRIDPSNHSATFYNDFENITVIHEKDKDFLWIGSSTGLYLFNKDTGELTRINLPTASSYIYSLCQTDDGKLYIGTNGSGLLVYDAKENSFINYHKYNSPVISNNIYTILCHGNGDIIFSSERGLTRFCPVNNDFHNWTVEQGLQSNHFNSNSGTVRSNGHFVFGGAEGVVEFSKDMNLPLNYSSKMIFSEFNLFYEPVYPGDANSPLQKDINDTEELVLNYDQNIFSLKVSSINYDYPSDVLYSWKLEGFYDTWSRPGSENLIRFTNLNPGKYTLMVRAISNETRQTIEERSFHITIKPPFWRSSWALIFYALLLLASIFFIYRLLNFQKQKKISEDKFQFFINTAHDIRTPLTLVKAPLDEIKNNEILSPEGTRNMNTALRNVNVLLRLTNNLMNFEHTDIYSSKLYISEYEINTIMNDIVRSFHTYATTKRIDFTYHAGFKYLNAWFDKEKMDSIIRNIISNALKYTREGGTVSVRTSESIGHWSVEVSDTGIGIPATEQKRMFHDHFRGTNAINSKVTGSGMGMVLVGRLVRLHKGKITLKSAENEGTIIKVSFPKGYNHFKRAHLALPFNKSNPNEEFIMAPVIETTPLKINTGGKKILVVEDNDELRNYLAQTLSEEYHVQTCENGKDALEIVKEYMPELVISDIMMPELSGDELCSTLKKDIDTSHIPIILLTALNDEKSIIKGIQTGADEYIVKPFNISILKATIANLLSNRALLRNKFAEFDISQDEDKGTNMNCATDLDWKFMANLRTHIENNISNIDFNVDVLSSLMNMSRTSMYNKIKVLTDMAPSDYIRIIRLKRAAELLKEDKYSITEVAEMTGFSDAKYFREVFKKHYNVSPSKYKN